MINKLCDSKTKIASAVEQLDRVLHIFPAHNMTGFDLYFIQVYATVMDIPWFTFYQQNNFYQTWNGKKTQISAKHYLKAKPTRSTLLVVNVSGWEVVTVLLSGVNPSTTNV